jgi:hypothetical protein
VTGVLKMRTYLSGMPECKLGLNDKVRSSIDLKCRTIVVQIKIDEHSAAAMEAAAAAE